MSSLTTIAAFTTFVSWCSKFNEVNLEKHQVAFFCPSAVNLGQQNTFDSLQENPLHSRTRWSDNKE